MLLAPAVDQRVDGPSMNPDPKSTDNAMTKQTDAKPNPRRNILWRIVE